MSINTMIIKKSEFRKALIENGFSINEKEEYPSIDKIIDDEIHSCVHDIQVSPSSISIRYANMDDSFIIDMDVLWFGINDIICASGGLRDEEKKKDITILNFMSADKRLFKSDSQFIIIKTILENYYNKPFKPTPSARMVIKDYYRYLPEVFKSCNPFDDCEISMVVSSCSDLLKVIISFNEDYTVIIEPWSDTTVNKAFIYRSFHGMGGSLIHGNESYYKFPGYEVDISANK